MSKKILVIIVVVAIVALAALLLYFFIFRGESVLIVGEETTIVEELKLSGDAADSTNPAVGVTSLEGGAVEDIVANVISEDDAVLILGQFEELISSDTIGSTLTIEGERIQYYDVFENTFYSVTLIGTDPVVLKSPTYEIAEMAWSPDKQKMVYQADDSAYFYETLGTDEMVDLGSDINSPVFVQDSMIAYQYKDSDTEQFNICVASPAEGLDNYTKLVAMRGNITLRNIPGRDMLAYYLSPSATRAAVVYATDFTASQLQMLIAKAEALDVDWSPNAATMAFTKMGGNNRAVLWLANGEGKNQRQVKQSSFIDKLAWTHDSSILYIASPVVMPTAAKYYDGQKTNDRIYKVNIETGESELVLDMSKLTAPVDARDLFLSPNDKLLYFRNDYDSSIFVVNLEKIRKESAAETN